MIHLLACVLAVKDEEGVSPPPTDSGPSTSTTDDTATSGTTDSTPPGDSTDSTTTTTPTPVDTGWPSPGVAMVYYEVELQREGAGGRLGFRWRNQWGDALCELMAPMEPGVPVPDGCPACEWTFGGTAWEATWAGVRCDELGLHDYPTVWADALARDGREGVFGYSSDYVFEDSPHYTWTSVIWGYNFTGSRWQLEYANNILEPGEHSVRVDIDTVTGFNPGYEFYPYPYP